MVNTAVVQSTDLLDKYRAIKFIINNAKSRMISRWPMMKVTAQNCHWFHEREKTVIRTTNWPNPTHIDCACVWVCSLWCEPKIEFAMAKFKTVNPNCEFLYSCDKKNPMNTRNKIWIYALAHSLTVCLFVCFFLSVFLL